MSRVLQLMKPASAALPAGDRVAEPGAADLSLLALAPAGTDGAASLSAPVTESGSVAPEQDAAAPIIPVLPAAGPEAAAGLSGARGASRLALLAAAGLALAVAAWLLLLASGLRSNGQIRPAANFASPSPLAVAMPASSPVLVTTIPGRMASPALDEYPARTPAHTGRAVQAQVATPSGVTADALPVLAAAAPVVARHERQEPDVLLQAWQAYQHGRLDEARALYARVLASEADNRDALLGMAAIALREGDWSAAAARYRQRLRQAPHDALAREGLASLAAQAQPAAGQEGDEQDPLPDASVEELQLLAHAHAGRQRWQAAQALYFRAWSQAPHNAELAYNLALALDHLGQYRQAREFYRKALAAGMQAADRLDRDAIAQRLVVLAGADS
ncbi:tetratricopeptide repeat protein [Chitinilyticum litopenaei]|uniref:tetratricopeptide repeat protein n=1 Tax=Chitinilyticum litopenaei TaxID=1121276 RepID=UPI000421CDC1|nr:tetratricopeptide repeat protein [Chitinilyticum litopenaei]